MNRAAISWLLPILHRPPWKKLQATERYINRSGWYLFRSTRCKTARATVILPKEPYVKDKCIASMTPTNTHNALHRQVTWIISDIVQAQYPSEITIDRCSFDVRLDRNTAVARKTTGCIMIANNDNIGYAVHVPFFLYKNMQRD